MSYAELSRKLGYANQSTLTTVKNHTSFIHIEKLEQFATLLSQEGKSIDLNWLITGKTKENKFENNKLNQYPHLIEFLNNIDSNTLGIIDKYLHKQAKQHS